MTSLELLMWWLLAAAGVVGCGLFAGLETGIYSLNRLRLHMSWQMGQPRARLLHQLLNQRSALIASLLIATNLFTNLATSAIGLLLESRLHAEWQVILADVLIVTPLLFVLSEVLPKDLFAAHADRLVYPLAPVLVWTRRLCQWTGLLPLIGLVSETTMRWLGAPRRVTVFHPRHLVGSLVKDAAGGGLVSDEQSAIVERVLELAERTVDQEMQPWQRIAPVPADGSPTLLWELARTDQPHHHPVVDASGVVVGVVDILDGLRHGPESCPPIRQLMEPALFVPRDMPLRAALAQLQRGGQALAVVTDRSGKPVGLVTVKDLIEPITGELANW